MTSIPSMYRDLFFFSFFFCLFMFVVKLESCFYIVIGCLFY
jgi:hypothetical protein